MEHDQPPAAPVAEEPNADAPGPAGARPEDPSPADAPPGTDAPADDAPADTSGGDGPRRLATVGRMAGVVALAVALGLFALAVAERIVFAGDVMPGVVVAGVDLGGNREADARDKVDEIATRLTTETIRATAGGVELAADPAEFGLSVDAEAVLAAARRAGRSGNPIEQTLGMVLRRVRDESVALPVSVDDNAVDAVIERWQGEVDRAVENGSLRFEGTEVVEVDSKAGRRIDVEAARRIVVDQLRRADRTTAEIPVEEVPAPLKEAAIRRAAEQARALLARPFVLTRGDASITIRPEQLVKAMSTRVRGERLELELDPAILGAAVGADLLNLVTPAQDAGFEVLGDDTVRVVPSVNGRQLDMPRAIEIILRGQRRRFPAPMRLLRPERDTKWAEALGITERVSSYTTYHPPGQTRVTNIHRAADIMNNTIVEPGEVFSLNDTIGPRTAERGFVSAPVYYEGFTEDFGGGVSQIATTTFNAVFWGGYDDVYHKPHSVYFDRYPMGREATVNYGTVDLKFRNDTNHGVLIRTSYSDSSITVTFYGNNEGRVVKEVSPGCESTTPSERCLEVLETLDVEEKEVPCPSDPTTVLRDDPDNVCAGLRPGQRYSMGSGHTGYVVQYGRVVERADGTTDGTTYRWSYVMDPIIVLIGHDPRPPTTTTTGGGSTTTGAPPTSGPTTTTTPSGG